MSETSKTPNSFRFFTNRDCQYFPCHKDSDPDEHNCLFCFCPLYALGDRCGGNFTYLEDGIKDCQNCLLPHKARGYDYITEKYDEIKRLAERR